MNIHINSINYLNSIVLCTAGLCQQYPTFIRSAPSKKDEKTPIIGPPVFIGRVHIGDGQLIHQRSS